MAHWRMTVAKPSDSFVGYSYVYKVENSADIICNLSQVSEQGAYRR